METIAMQDPRTKYPAPPFPKQPQSVPGLAAEMIPTPDHGETSYKGSGRLAGRRALITGGDSGIGRAAAIAYAREGADIALSYLPEEERDAQAVVALIRDAGRRAIALPGKLVDEASCIGLIKKAEAELGGLDTLVIVAGHQQACEDILELSTEQFDETFKTNVYALFWLCKAAVPSLKPGSTIITTTSIQAYEPSASLLDYAQTKAAIVAFTKALAKQLAEKGIRVNSVAPGPIWTPLQSSGGQPQDKIPTFGAQTPLGRPGQPAELAGVYVLLASEDSSYITGETFGVTGGNPRP
jgi:NAD(P)-dependent dehydrogenase (short-subunit alcohol dehydrogenase family)